MWGSSLPQATSVDTGCQQQLLSQALAVGSPVEKSQERRQRVEFTPTTEDTPVQTPVPATQS